MSARPPLTAEHPEAPGRVTAPFFLLAILLWALFTAATLNLAPLFDYDEAVYAETAAEMLRSGDWVFPTANGQAFFEKPPLVYYLMDLSFLAFGQNAFAARLPSALFTLLTAALLYVTGRRLGSSEVGMVSSLVFVSMFMPAILAHSALLDATLNFFLACSILCFFLWKVSERERYAVIASLAAGIAISVKGPVGAVVPLLVIGIHELLSRTLIGSLRRFPWTGCAVFFLLGAAPWYLIVAATHGVGFLKEFILVQNVGRFSRPMQGHGGGWYYYLLVLIPSTLPWTAWLPRWGKRALSRPRETDVFDRLSRFAWIWTVVVIVLFSFAGTKLPHYISPICPAIALGIATLWHPRDLSPSAVRLSAAVHFFAVLPFAAGLVALSFLYTPFTSLLKHPKVAAVLAQDVRPGPWIAVGGMLLAAYLAYCTWRTLRIPSRNPLAQSIVLGLVFQGILLVAVAPFAGKLVQGPMMVVADQIRASPAAEAVYSLTSVPSVSFYSGRSYRSVKISDVQQHLDAKSPFLLIARQHHRDELAGSPLAVVVQRGDLTLLRYGGRP